MGLVMRVLVSLLLEPSAVSSAPAASLKLHDNALQRLTKLGPLYPAQFRSVVVAAPELKVRLEAAIKAQQQQQHSKEQAAKAGGRASGSSAHPANAPAKPSITLKMDFSNFGARS
jgi:hypothetical protein